MTLEMKKETTVHSIETRDMHAFMCRHTKFLRKFGNHVVHDRFAFRAVPGRYLVFGGDDTTLTWPPVGIEPVLVYRKRDVTR